MKTLIGFIASVLMILSVPTWAVERVVITGAPVVLEQQNGVYTLPADYTTTGNYYYVTMDGAKSVCYLEEQPTLSTLTKRAINVKVKGETVQWNCYPVDETYFQVMP